MDNIDLIRSGNHGLKDTTEAGRDVESFLVAWQESQ
jgi:hypothetical protein